VRKLCAGCDERPGFRQRPVPDYKGRTGFRQVQRHRFAHRAESDKTERLCCHALPPNYLGEWHCIPLGRIRKSILIDATHYDT
jgi:hypothetical protein